MLYSAVLAAVLAVCIATTVSAGEKFSLSVIPGAFYGRYDGSLYRDKIQGASLYIEGRLATQWGIAGRYDDTVRCTTENVVKYFRK